MGKHQQGARSTSGRGFDIAIPRRWGALSRSTQMFRVLQTVAVATLLVSASAVALPSSATAAVGSTNGNTVVQLTNTTPCQDVTFLGLRGSGETAADANSVWGMGARVTAVYNSFIANMKNRNIAAVGVDYVSEKVPIGPSFTIWAPIAWGGYFKSIDSGVNSLEAILINRTHNCPNEHFVLAGYSQGAMAIHRAVFDLSRAPAGGTLSRILPRIDAVATLGDGDRLGGDNVVTLGTSTNSIADYGIGQAFLSASGDTYKATPAQLSTVGYGLNSRWFQDCELDDIVCDFGVARSNLATGAVGATIHVSAYTKNNPAVVGAGQNLAKTSMAANPLKISYSASPAVVGSPYVGTFTETSGYPLTSLISTLGSLPPGLTFGGASGISGTPTSAGSWTFSYLAVDRVGQTAIGTITIVVAPGSAAGTAQIATGNMHTCALTKAGGVKCWGEGTNGQLGDGLGTSSNVPVDVLGLADGVASISAGAANTCAVTTAGAVLCWGDNSSGQLGDGTTTRRLTPTAVTGLPPVAAVVSGAYHTCALLKSGGVACWGDNSHGQLGDGTTTQRLQPVDASSMTSGIASIAAGDFHTCAVSTAGAASCWGNNSAGQLGNGTTTDSAVPSPVVSLGSGVSGIAGGTGHTCAALTDGTVWCWGDNQYGDLGDGTTTQRSQPVSVGGLAGKVKQISAGTFATCALADSGATSCWGYNDFGELGNGSTQSTTVPTNVLNAPFAFTQISLKFAHTCGISADSGSACWGYGYHGQLGNGANSNSSVPVVVVGL